MSVRDLLGGTIISAFFIGFIYLIVLKVFGGIIIYASIVAILLGSAAGGLMLWTTGEAMTEPKDAQFKQYYEYGAYAAFGFTALLFVCVCCNWKNIKIGVAVMKCTASFVGSTP